MPHRERFVCQARGGELAIDSSWARSINANGLPPVGRAIRAAATGSIEEPRDLLSNSTAAAGASPSSRMVARAGQPYVHRRVVPARKQQRHRLGLQPPSHEREHVQ